MAVRHRLTEGGRLELAERLRSLADLAPILESPDADFGHWEEPPPVDGVYRMPYFTFGPAAEAVRSAVAHGDWMRVGFDWGAWLQTDRGQELRDRPDAIGEASVEELSWLLTAIIRSDRFVEGSMAGAFESGHLARIAHRAAALLAETQP
jgi:hypothetical protein